MQVRAALLLAESVGLALIPVILIPVLSALVGRSYSLLLALGFGLLMGIAGQVFISFGFLLSTVFVSATNLLSSQAGHMQHVVFNLIDPDHHTELWEFVMADGKKMGGLLDLKRTK